MFHENVREKQENVLGSQVITKSFSTKAMNEYELFGLMSRCA